MATPTTFDPNMLTDPSLISPLYSSDSGQASDRLKLLQDALAYVQANPSLSNYDYLMSELQGDIAAEQGVAGYDTAQAGVDTASNDYNNLSRVISAIQGGQGGNLNKVTTGDWNNLSQQFLANGDPTVDISSIFGWPKGTAVYPASHAIQLIQQTNPGKLYMVGDALNSSGALDSLGTTFANKLSAANSGFTKAGTGLVDAFRLPSPDLNAARDALMSYYHDPKTGQIALSTQPAIDDIYQKDYRLRNDINTKAAALGATSSGMRKKALDTANGEAVNQAVQVKSNAENEAAQNIAGFDANAQKQKLAAQNLTNQIKSGGASNIFSDASKNAILNYGSNASAAEQGYLTDAEQKIQQQQADDSFWGQLAGGFGDALGKFGMALI